MGENWSFMRTKLQFIREKTGVRSRENFSKLPNAYFMYAYLFSEDSRDIPIYRRRKRRVVGGCPSDYDVEVGDSCGKQPQSMPSDAIFRDNFATGVAECRTSCCRGVATDSLSTAPSFADNRQPNPSSDDRPDCRYEEAVPVAFASGCRSCNPHIQSASVHRIELV